MPAESIPVAPAPFAEGLVERSELRRRITLACRRPEAQAVQELLPQAELTEPVARAVRERAVRLATRLRERRGAGGRDGLVQGLLQEYALSSKEGIALMCLAEALLRIPDAATRDALIRDKIAEGHWREHVGRSASPFVNAATWGLLLTGRLVALHSEDTLSALLTRLIARGGEPLIRKGVDAAMRILGEHFVTGQTIDEALERARKREAQGFRYSYDMLGEAALTAGDARRYRQAYEDAIHAIGRAAAGRGVVDGPGISIKLSALHPRYSRAQYGRVIGELHPALHELAALARRYDIGLNIDAEEADRLELSLDLLERLCFEPDLSGWHGIGFVVQAYQKRCPFVIDRLIDLARRSGHRLMVRLVKGAYWDSEIKRAQVDGQAGYPVYTRKAHTDVSYLACARRLLAAGDAVYPQFATHNAHTLAALYELADPSAWRPGQYEFQCLHGMGEPLYEQVVGATPQGRPCRIYAPVGTHETLLAYLVRRLLENGANTSFVNRIADPSIPIDALVESPVDAVRRAAAQEGAVGAPHPAISLPAALYGGARVNSSGMDLASDECLAGLQRVLAETAGRQGWAGPMLADVDGDGSAAASIEAVPFAESGPVAEPGPITDPDTDVRNPADHRDLVGRVTEATPADIDRALAAAVASSWPRTPAAARAALLEAAADRLQANMPPLLGLLAREAGKTIPNGIAEVREAVDFLRYYASRVRGSFDEQRAPLGPTVCISPWNFPLAIFVGQIAGALAAGNPVLAKPAEQTPLTAAEAVRLMRQAGLPDHALQLLPGRGETVGARLVADQRVQAVLFTGSTEVARILQRTLAQRLGADGRPVPLVAETGGQNAMIVDSSALPEQVVGDVMTSAFDSAGQRCSALRVLCVQTEAADRIVEMLKGAMAESRLGDPLFLATDVGPVIDDEARAGIERHIERMAACGHRIHRLCAPPVESALTDAPADPDGRIDQASMRPDGIGVYGTFVTPTLIEIDSIAELDREVFGPVLHLLRYRRQDLGRLIEQINATGYGLTLGVHSRIDETVDEVLRSARAGNVYVNRNIVGAVVGVQPFGGEGLSGTGPKAGGPLYLYRLSRRRDANAAPSAQRDPFPLTSDNTLSQALADEAAAFVTKTGAAPPAPQLATLERWAEDTGRGALAQTCRRFRAGSRSGWSKTLTGPTGERNVYALRARGAAWCVAAGDDDRLTQLAAVLSVGGRAVWSSSAATAALHAALPAGVRHSVELAEDAALARLPIDVALHHGDANGLLELGRLLARRDGPVVPLWGFDTGDTRLPLEALVVERSVSINTAAAGGNASLMMIG